ncbi:hypothetical protein [Companilactobacillus kimchiensis]|uniref:Lipoprotein n=1 Tax=Companilactobacillus kimchiensis TaxID=993692 RepID=A0A0R2LAQ2_9LACO|nr:hypothetical protein [Companilactobacillus kimchiensis]KRN98930.1 lipoprotein [Companilactobacillus kimchiensis]
MHGKQRDPINQKYLIISIIGVVIFAILLSVLTLKNTGKATNPTASQPKTEYKSIKKSLDKSFNQNGRVVAVKEENNINDSTSKHPHTVIIVKLTDKQTQKYMKTSFEAVQAGNAQEDQKMYIYSIQKIISTQAKKLDNNYDVIQFVYKDGKKYVPVASSQKNRFLIKPVKIKQPTQKATAS